MKTVQDMKVEMELLKQSQTEIKLEMKTLGSETKTSEHKTWKRESPVLKTRLERWIPQSYLGH